MGAIEIKGIDAGIKTTGAELRRDLFHSGLAQPIPDHLHVFVGDKQELDVLARAPEKIRFHLKQLINEGFCFFGSSKLPQYGCPQQGVP